MGQYVNRTEVESQKVAGVEEKKHRMKASS